MSGREIHGTEDPASPRPSSRPTSVLVIVRSEPGVGAAITPARVIGGLALVRRIALAATAAGYGQVVAAELGASIRELLRGTSATALTPADAVPTRSPGRVVLLPSNVVPQQSWLHSILEMPIASETIFIDSSMTMVVETKDSGRVITAAMRCSDASALAAELRRTFSEGPWPLESDGRFPILVARDVSRAEGWLLRNLIKRREGFMSRHFERRISLALTRRLAPTAVTPNTMTAVSTAIGLSSTPFFVSSSAPCQLTGALLFLAHSILDGCDGELARLKFLRSRLGAALDFWGDNVVHVAVFTSIAIGWSLAVGTAWPLALGGLAGAATIASATVMFKRTVEDAPTTRDSTTARLLDGLASRDFIYLLILASAFGKAAWFLAVVAAGTPTFLLLVLWLDHGRGRVR